MFFPILSTVGWFRVAISPFRKVAIQINSNAGRTRVCHLETNAFKKKETESNAIVMFITSSSSSGKGDFKKKSHRVFSPHSVVAARVLIPVTYCHHRHCHPHPRQHQCYHCQFISKSLAVVSVVFVPDPLNIFFLDGLGQLFDQNLTHPSGFASGTMCHWNWASSFLKSKLIPFTLHDKYH